MRDDEHDNPSLNSLARDIGGRVRVQRTRRGWSQEVLADIAGLHRNYISLLECGKIQISVAKLVQIAQALEVRPGSLIDGPSDRASSVDDIIA